MALDTKPYKGTRDFYPADKQIQNYIFSIWRKSVENFGYLEYDAPIIEPIEIYASKTSLEIVSDQTYAFEDRGGRKITLRPEMTPSVSRMVAAKRQEFAYPLRLYSIPNVWRYERPQRGRLREHWQLNADIFGVNGIEGDFEIITLADKIMQNFSSGRDMYTVRLNSRKLVNYILTQYIDLGEEQAQAVIRLIDHIHKMNSEHLKTAIEEVVGDKTQQVLEIFKITDLKDFNQEFKQHPAFLNLHKLYDMLTQVGISNVSIDITLMRGFDYYTDIVFEIFDTNPENNRSLFGGGRYDDLVSLFGVESISTVGFGMGDVTLQEFLKLHNLLPRFKLPVDLNVIVIGDVFMQSQNVIVELRQSGLKVAVDATTRKIDKQVKSAVKAGFEWVMFIGDKELSDNVYKLKQLSTGQEYSVSLDEIIQRFKDIDNNS